MAKRGAAEQPANNAASEWGSDKMATQKAGREELIRGGGGWHRRCPVLVCAESRASAKCVGRHHQEIADIRRWAAMVAHK